jgi:hypothetical protein
MSNALDNFEQSLVAASRRLSDAPARFGTASANGSAPNPGSGRRRGRLRGLTVAAQLSWFAIGATALAATGGITVALLFQGNSTKTIASFTCATARNGGGAGVPAVTGNPLIDCATAWPSATEGRQTAPSLTAWSAVGKAINAVVEPSAWGPPAITRLKTGRDTSVPVHWEKLPANWTVDLDVVVLNDQLSAIPAGMSLPSQCLYPARAVAITRSLLVVDHLSGWHIKLQALRGSIAQACRHIVPNVDGGIRTVQLLQAGAAEPTIPTHIKPRIAALDRGEIAADKKLDSKLVALQSEISRSLATRCQSVSAATALWTSDAATVGVHATTPAYFRALNANRNAGATRFDFYYTLFRQPASQHTGNCAHVLVMQLGGGAILVYAARIAP